MTSILRRPASGNVSLSGLVTLTVMPSTSISTNGDAMLERYRPPRRLPSPVVESSHGLRDREDRRAVAGRAVPGGVPGAPSGGDRAALHRELQRHQDRGRLPLQGVWQRAVPQPDEVRLALRLAVVLPAERVRRGGADRGRLTRDAAHGGPLPTLRFASRARLRRRPPDADGGPLLHQLRVDQPGAGPTVGPVPARGSSPRSAAPGGGGPARLPGRR